MKPDHQQVHELIKDTVSLLCKNGLTYEKVIRVEGVIGITIDESDVFIIHINDTLDQVASSSSSSGGPTGFNDEDRKRMFTNLQDFQARAATKNFKSGVETNGGSDDRQRTENSAVDTRKNLLGSDDIFTLSSTQTKQEMSSFYDRSYYYQPTNASSMATVSDQNPLKSEQFQNEESKSATSDDDDDDVDDDDGDDDDDDDDVIFVNPEDQQGENFSEGFQSVDKKSKRSKLEEEDEKCRFANLPAFFKGKTKAVRPTMSNNDIIKPEPMHSSQEYQRDRRVPSQGCTELSSSTSVDAMTCNSGVVGTSYVDMNCSRGDVDYDNGNYDEVEYDVDYNAETENPQWTTYERNRITKRGAGVQRKVTDRTYLKQRISSHHQTQHHQLQQQQEQGATSQDLAWGTMTLTKFVCKVCGNSFNHRPSLLAHQIKIHGRQKNKRGRPPARQQHYEIL